MANYLGIDIGGTKSHALIADETGRVLGFGSGGAGNHETVGYPGLRRVLQKITTAALQQAGLKKSDLDGAGFGIAGYDWPSERKATLDAIATLELACPLEAVNDTVIGLLAGAREGWGIAIVAGTGENCWGRDRKGQIGRVTGNGVLMGEYGGAGTIVLKAVHAVASAWAQRGPETRLLDMMLEQTRAPAVDELLEGLALGSYRLGSECAPLVVQTAEEGDPVAVEILEWSGTELADLATGVIRQLSLENEVFEVVLVGSMFQSSELLRETFFRNVRRTAPHALFVPLEAPPVVGGVLLAMEAAGAQAWSARGNLIASAREVLP